MDAQRLKYYSALIIISLSISACDDNITFQPEGDYVSGYISFVDTFFVTHRDHYSVALYPIETPPFYSRPVECTKIHLESNQSTFYFRISYQGQGTFYLAAVWNFDYNSFCKHIVLVIYGCDTTHGCTTYKYVDFPNFTGLDHNFLCWSDTSKRLF